MSRPLITLTAWCLLACTGSDEPTPGTSADTAEPPETDPDPPTPPDDTGSDDTGSDDTGEPPSDDLDGSTGRYEVDIQIEWADGTSESLVASSDVQDVIFVSSNLNGIGISAGGLGERMASFDIDFRSGELESNVFDHGADPDALSFLAVRQLMPEIVRFEATSGTTTVLACPTVPWNETDGDPPDDAYFHVAFDVEATSDDSRTVSVVGQARGPSEASGGLFPDCP